MGEASLSQKELIYIDYFNALMAEVRQANIHFQIWKALTEATNKYNAELNEARVFFASTIYAHLKSSITHACKLIDEHPDALSIINNPAASCRVSKYKQTVSVVIATRECHCEEDYFERSVREMEIKDIDRSNPTLSVVLSVSEGSNDKSLDPSVALLLQDDTLCQIASQSLH